MHKISDANMIQGFNGELDEEAIWREHAMQQRMMKAQNYISSE